MPWYAQHRDMPNPPYGLTQLYRSLPELKRRFARKVMNADLCIVGSYVPEGVALGEWVLRTCRGVKAFYDIDTPVTLAKLAAGDTEYVTARLVRRYDLYLSFAGGPVLRKIENELGSPMARALYCSVDPKVYFPEERALKWDLGYMGTYSVDRQSSLDLLLVDPARRSPKLKTVVAGPMYPHDLAWPPNVERIEHLPPASHRRFYNSQRFTLNLTRADMRTAGFSPSVRIFEAAACGTPIISDYWTGLETFFELEKEILTGTSPEEVLTYLNDIPEKDRRTMSERARLRVLASHTSEQRVLELESYVAEVMKTATTTTLSTQSAEAIARRLFFSLETRRATALAKHSGAARLAFVLLKREGFRHSDWRSGLMD
jgi:spore maturation protein CgeB